MNSPYLSEQLFRDLQWLIESPMLINKIGLPFDSNVASPSIIDSMYELVDGVKNRKKIEQQLAYHRETLALHFNGIPFKRLGLYSEWLLNYWATHTQEIALLDTGVQVRDSITGRTLGELDFLLKSPDNLIHLELAVKYYLVTGDGSELKFYYGPNPRDRMDRKWHKMVYKQTQWLQSDDRLERYHFETDLSEELLGQYWKNLLLMKGKIFLHWNQTSLKQKLAPEINPSCEKGLWCYQREWKEYLSEQNPQLHWIV
jgi:hypothetical protein